MIKLGVHCGALTAGMPAFQRGRGVSVPRRKSPRGLRLCHAAHG